MNEERPGPIDIDGTETDLRKRRDALKKIAIFTAYTAPAAMIMMQSRKAQAQTGNGPVPV